jgi:sn-glycerol 3-phosphate transport system substrate-binding protein
VITRRSLLGGSIAALASSQLAACARASNADRSTVANLWFSYGGKNREVLLDLVGRFNASQSRVRIVATYQGDYFEALAKLRTAIAADAAPTFSHVVGEVLPYLAKANVLEPLDAYDGAGALDLVPQLAQSGSFEGGGEQPLVAIPFNRSTPIMYVNGDRLTKELGGSIPQTWDELRRAAATLTHGDGAEARWGYEVPISWWFWLAMVGQAGGEVTDAAGTPTLGGEAGERALRYWQTLVHQDHSMRPPPGRDFNAWEVTNQDFLSGRASIIWTSTAFLRYLEENARFPVVAAPLPRDVRASVPTGGTFFVVMRTAPTAEKLAAWEFLRWMCAPEQTIAWATRTGYLPVSRGAIDSLTARGYYREHPNDRVALDQLRDAQPWPWSPDLFRIERDVVEPKLEAAVLSNRDAHEALDEAREEARNP